MSTMPKQNPWIMATTRGLRTAKNFTNNVTEKPSGPGAELTLEENTTCSISSAESGIIKSELSLAKTWRSEVQRRGEIETTGVGLAVRREAKKSCTWREMTARSSTTSPSIKRRLIKHLRLRPFAMAIK